MNKVIVKIVDLFIFAISPIFKLCPIFVLYFLIDSFSIVPTRFGVMLRYICFKLLSPDSGSNIYIGRFVTLKSMEQLKVGSNVSIHEYCYIDAKGGINIGDNVSIAHNTSILSFNHTFSDPHTPIKYNRLVIEPIFIGSDVWIGCGCRILSGVKIGQRSVIGAGSVVSKEIYGNSLYLGVPAKKIRDI
ncbi:acyltransferase [Vibrio fluvialis]|uniref:acyltransferase n=1 Tax=Vibrio fluvialis TaxID=676 RepID=UPI00192B97E6|nr:acyltransferase [Vibrio fluvialis]